ncbi:FAD-dependent oxidoreductase [Hyphomonas johnsonii]|uniref:Selenide water dikinase SelD n=1 Tax=Hyphomonas johnsonii MHS-2 TaxID=1280950 RepID=A0A059FVG3_9PROT|nr:FAD-dependent oxidoreductase [Hyphomonas johnsonii]KCZ94577.1 selenide water dikinase SelD [Hyphomonas johnsonii MHS-2]
MIRILLIGGGHAHVVALRHLARHPAEGVELCLVNPDDTSAYSGMLPGMVAGHWARDALSVPLSPLCRAAGATLLEAAVTQLDPIRQQAVTNTGAVLDFDFASLDVGAIAAVQSPESLRRLGVPAKPLGAFADAWLEFVAEVESGRRAPTCAVIGSGLAGVELALSMHHRLGSIPADIAPQVTIIDQAEDILPGANLSLRSALRTELKRAGIRTCVSQGVVKAEQGKLTLTSRQVVDADFVALATGATAHAWIAGSGLALQHGFVEVDATLRSVSHPVVFACGDTAHLAHAALPKAGVFAVRQGKVLAEQVRRLAEGSDLATYVPQKDYLKLVSLGRRAAIAEKWGLALKLPGFWALKRRIDMAFIRGDNPDRSDSG